MLIRLLQGADSAVEYPVEAVYGGMRMNCRIHPRPQGLGFLLVFPQTENLLSVVAGSYSRVTCSRSLGSVHHIAAVTIPDDALTDDLDYGSLAGIELTGGTIRNAAQTAAVLAADDPDAVGVPHAVAAVRRELATPGTVAIPRRSGSTASTCGPDRLRRQYSASESSSSTLDSTHFENASNTRCTSSFPSTTRYTAGSSPASVSKYR